MSHLCCRPRFPQETKPGRLVTEISLAEDLKRHATLQSALDRFVRTPPCPPPHRDRFPVFARHQSIVLKPLRRLFRRCRLDTILGSKGLAGLNPTGKTLAKQAYRTEFRCSRKLVTAT